MKKIAFIIFPTVLLFLISCGSKNDIPKELLGIYVGKDVLIEFRDTINFKAQQSLFRLGSYPNSLTLSDSNGYSYQQGLAYSKGKIVVTKQEDSHYYFKFQENSSVGLDYKESNDNNNIKMFNDLTGVVFKYEDGRKLLTIYSNGSDLSTEDDYANYCHMEFLCSFESISEKTDDYNITDNDLKYKFFVSDKENKMAKIGDIITVDMEYGFCDSVLFNSTQMPQPLRMQVTEPLFQGDFMEVIVMMHKGDSAEFLMPTDSVFQFFFRAQVPQSFYYFENMWFRIRLTDIKTKEEADMERQQEMESKQAEEKAQRDAYLKQENINVQPTESGLYYIETKKGSGKKPEPGETVQVHYTGYLLDGTKFDSSLDRDKVFEFPLGQGRVIPGWDEGIGMMRVGGKAKLIIPSSLGYGERGAGQAIPPFSTLIFDVELVGIK